MVRRIFDFALGSAGTPLGVKAIVNHLNGSGYRYRGRPFHISSVHRILTATTYMGVHQFNRREARSGQGKAPEEWIPLAVPQIITADDSSRCKRACGHAVPNGCRRGSWAIRPF